MQGTERDDAPRQRDRSATEMRLLDAAEKVFARAGYDGASVREIAEAADANVSLINRYFGGKEGLLLGITERFIQTKAYAELPYPIQPSLSDEIYHYLHHRLAEDTSHEPMIRLMVNRVSVDDTYRQNAQKMMSSGADENFKQRIDAHKALGSVPAETDTNTLFAMIAYFSFSISFFAAIVEKRSAEEVDALLAEFAHAMGRAAAS